MYCLIVVHLSGIVGYEFPAICAFLYWAVKGVVLHM
jgi:hypothetical protein